jgi:hypothetical protein
MFKYYRTIPYGRRSIYIDKWGEVAHEPTRDIIFVDDSTGEIFISNDLKIKIYKRNKKIKAFYEFYNHYFKKKLVSIVLYVVNVKCISSISNQLKSIRKKLKKKQIQLLANYWQRDIGEKKFEPHFHLMLALPRINIELFNQLFEGDYESGAKAELCDDLQKFTKYLMKKKFFAPFKQKNNSISRKLLKPSLISK